MLGARSWVLSPGPWKQGHEDQVLKSRVLAGEVVGGSETYLHKEEGLGLGVLSDPGALFPVTSRRLALRLPHWSQLLLPRLRPTGTAVTAVTASTAWTPARRVSGGGTPPQAQKE